MSHGKIIKKRTILPESKFNNLVLAKFINCIMISGQKSKAEAFVYQALNNLKNKLDVEEMELFDKIVQNVKPIVEVKSKRVGGTTQRVPIEVGPNRSIALSLRWLIKAIRSRNGKNIVEKIESEFADAYEMKGAAIKKRDEMHRIAEDNKAYSPYQW